ncbi:hypothetical protein PVAP13_5NG194300 [Panicum virgatum]|uniref:CP12 domain-containing protein n=1 Tax=Panicum virgatum TaxID=38727 RepID=A0A8T0RQ35_PANVG|nr:hypothetical protein PVAP13_5NG194300 [Panicum virgatum]
MASTVASLTTPATFAAADVVPRRKVVAGRVWFPVARRGGFAVMRSSGPATPPGISDKVSESIKKAEETCAEETASGDHARDKLKENSDPLENYCKENPEADECRTYDN